MDERFNAPLNACARMAQKYNAADFVEAIEAANGVVSNAARKLGCARSTVTRAVKRYTSVEEALAEARDVTVDDAESQLIQAMQRGEEWAVKMILRTQGGTRFEKTEKKKLEHSGGVEQQVSVYIPDNGRDAD